MYFIYSNANRTMKPVENLLSWKEEDGENDGRDEPNQGTL
jgi:hypothetical protein